MMMTLTESTSVQPLLSVTFRKYHPAMLVAALAMKGSWRLLLKL